PALPTAAATLSRGLSTVKLPVRLAVPVNVPVISWLAPPGTYSPSHVVSSTAMLSIANRIAVAACQLGTPNTRRSTFATHDMIQDLILKVVAFGGHSVLLMRIVRSPWRWLRTAATLIHPVGS